MVKNYQAFPSNISFVKFNPQSNTEFERHNMCTIILLKFFEVFRIVINFD
jgi:hypothetical protein